MKLIEADKAGEAINIIPGASRFKFTVSEISLRNHRWGELWKTRHGKNQERKSLRVSTGAAGGFTQAAALLHCSSSITVSLEMETQHSTLLQESASAQETSLWCLGIERSISTTVYRGGGVTVSWFVWWIEQWMETEAGTDSTKCQQQDNDLNCF